MNHLTYASLRFCLALTVTLFFLDLNAQDPTISIRVLNYPNCSGGGQLFADLHSFPNPIFSWSSGGTGQSEPNLRPGIYSLTVTSSSLPTGGSPYAVAGIFLIDKAIEYSTNNSSWSRGSSVRLCANPVLRSNPCLALQNSRGIPGETPVNQERFPRQWQFSSNGSNFRNISGANAIQYQPNQTGYYRVRFRYLNSTVGINSVVYTSSIRVFDDGGLYTLYRDSDGDGYGSTGSAIMERCSTKTGYVSIGGDCNDNSSRYNPGASEGCGDPDYNCNGQTVSNYTSAGSISGNQSVCGPYDPSAISNAGNPSGGSGGSAFYRWQVRTASGSWTNISGASSSSYNPGSISSTRYYRRLTRRSVCSSWIATNTVTKAVASNYTSAGTISGNQSVCGPYDPSTISNVGVPSGGSGGSVFYRWQVRTASGSWTNISGASDSSYNPGSISSTRYYRRGTRRSICSTWIFTNTVTKAVSNNVTSAGSISGNQSNCGSYNPTTVGNSSSASGGSGTLQYRWEYRNGTSGTWQFISNAGSSTYDPGTISGTRQYRRGARRSGCSTWSYTNTITKSVTSNVTSAGSISGNQSNCGSYNPTTISNSSSASGGSGTLQYRWEYRNGTSGTWQLISNAGSSTYDPGTISGTRQYRRGARRSGCSTWSYTNTITKSVTNNVTSAGSISGNQSNCGSYNPTTISNNSSASGGSGTLQYRWEYRNDTTGTWQLISNAGSSAYDPGTISGTRQYRRGARRSGCSTWSYTNTITKSVTNNVTSAGSISGNQSNCGSYNPTTISNSSSASGDSGTLQYRWEYRNGTSGTWQLISNAGSSTYDPGTISGTRQYRRGARRNGCSTWSYTNTITKSVTNNVTSAGSISGNQSNCGSYNPTAISNSSSASGGSGTLQYRWEYRNGTSGTWQLISNAGSSTYDPGTISGTRQYRRGARRNGCSSWSYSNQVTKSVVSELTNGGSISGNQNGCGSYNPSLIANSSLPSGGNGATIQYQWQVRAVGGNWSSISGANNITYDPGTITVSREYRRRAHRTACGNYVYSNTVTKTVNGLTNGGSITGGSTTCGAFNPPTISNSSAPSGPGTQTIQYQWQSRISGGTWSNINGATSSSYNPPTIGVTREYRRRSHRTACGNYVFSNVVTFTVTQNVTDAGSISGDQSECGTYDPDNIQSTSHATGGDGTLQFQWQYRIGTSGSWQSISNSNSSSYNPSSINSTRQYRRGARRSTCGVWIYTEPVTKSVEGGFTNGGRIIGEETECTAFNPAEITSTAGASGGGGSSGRYQWQVRSPGGSWSNIPNAIGFTYNPGQITSTREYRRSAWRLTCGNIVYSNTITKTVLAPLTDGGIIREDESSCGSFVSTSILSNSDASGGLGPAPHYQWQSRIPGGTWSDIVGAVDNSLSPGLIASTMQFRRSAYRDGCDTRIYSNIVTKQVSEEVDHACLATGTSAIGVQDGTIAMEIVGGLPPYQISWSGPSSGSFVTQGSDTIISGLGIGSYTVELSDASGCTSSCAATVNDPSCTLSASINQTASIDCHGEATASLDLFVTGGGGNYNYLWTGPTPIGNLEDPSELSSGLYSVTVSEGACEATANFNVSEPSSLTINCSAESTSLNGASDGTIAVNIMGGTPGYTVAWTGLENGSQIGQVGDNEVSGLPAGTYEITVTDDNGCLINCTSIVNDPSCTLAASINQTSGIDCHGEATASLDLSVTGGGGTYNYLWTGPTPIGNMEDPSELSSGLYSVTVSEGACEATASFNLSEPSSLTLNCSAESTSLNGASDGAISINIMGGTPGYTVAWTGPENGSQIGQVGDNEVSGMPAGTYEIAVTDENGCLINCTSIVNDPSCTLAASISQTSGIDCHGEATASLDLLVTGGGGNYTYLWTGPTPIGNIEDPSELSSGLYSVTISEGACEATASFNISEPSSLAVNCSAESTSLNGASDGAISVNIMGGTPDYTIAWTGLENGSQIGQVGDNEVSGLPAGTYEIMVTDENGCLINRTSIVNDPSCTLAASISQTSGIECQGEATASLDLSVTGGGGNYTYLWTGPTPIGNMEDPSELSSGLYSVTVSEGACEATANFNVGEPSSLIINCSAESTSLNGASDGAISVNIMGGTPGYTVAWTGLENGSRIGQVGDNEVSGLPAGTYEIAVTDENGCLINCTSIVNDPSCTLVASINQTASIECHGEATASLDLTVVGGGSNHSYSWSGPVPIGDVGNPSDLPAGSYSVTVTELTCEATANFTINEPAELEVSCSASATSLNGASDGSIPVLISGGTSDYSISWTGPTTGSQSGADGSNTIVDLPAGIYEIGVEDANGCSVSCTSEVTEPACDLSASISQVDVIPCHGESEASLLVAVEGGGGNHSYSWSGPVPMGYVGNPSDLPAGNYSVTVTELTCEATANFTINEPAELEVNCSASATSLNGANDGSISVTINGGTSSYTIRWIGPTHGSQSGSSGSNSIPDLVAGVYEISVEDANGCITTCSSEVREPACDLSASISQVDPILCHGESEASLLVAVNGGGGNHTYSWSGPVSISDVEDPSDLPAGNYSVTVTELTCEATANITINEPAKLEVNCSASATSLNGASDGSISVTINGGTSSYTIRWTGPTHGSQSGSSGSNSIPDLVAGVYEISVEDANGCIIMCSSEVTEPVCDLSASISQVDPILCHGESEASLLVAVNGGGGNYTYSWSGPVSISDVEDPSDLPAGNYSVTVTELTCEATANFTINEPAELEVNCSASATSLNGASDGSISVTINGGTSSYTIRWTGPTHGSQSGSSGSNSIPDLVAGVYEISVEDANGCITMCSSEVTEPACDLSASISQVDPILCHGESEASLLVTVNGGGGNHTYSWSGPVTISDVEDPSDLPAGNYSVTVTELTCEATANFTINEPAVLEVNCSASATSLNGASDGLISVTINGGASSYTIRWTGPTHGSQSGSSGSNSVPDLGAGVYEISVEDANGCITICSSEVTEPACDLSASISQVDPILCHGESEASLLVAVNGGGGNHTYSWSGPVSISDVEDPSDLLAGNYSVTVTELTCEATANTTINEPAKLEVNCSASATSLNGASDGSISVTISGGTSSHTIRWTGPTHGSQSGSSGSNSIPDLVAGVYEISVEDANGCITMCSSEVTEPACDLSASISQVDPILCHGESGASLLVAVNGGGGNHTYSWSGPVSISDLEDPSDLPAGSYSVTVTELTCEATANFTINEPAELEVNCSASSTSLNGASDGSISVLISGGTSDYSISWDGPVNGSKNGGSGRNSIGNLPAGEYQIVLTDLNGCLASCQPIVSEPDCDLSLSIDQVDQIVCFGDETASLDLNIFGGGGNFDFDWSGPVNIGNMENPSGLPAGSYGITVTELTCLATASIEILEPPELEINCSSSPETLDGRSDGTLLFEVVGGTANYEINWSGPESGGIVVGEGQVTAENLPAGQYQIVVVDAMGCLANCDVTISAPCYNNGGDSDGDGVCADTDCDDNNPAVPAPPGTACDDLDPHTLNDVIQEDQCTCLGVDPCADDGGDADLDGICDEQDCAPNDPEFPKPVGTPCDDGDRLTDNDRIQSDGCTCEGNSICTISASIVQTNQIKCGAESTADLSVNIFGGEPPFRFRWNDGSTRRNLSNRGKGDYWVRVTDALGCSERVSYTVNGPDEIKLMCQVTKHITQKGVDEGQASISISGGLAPYLISWNGAQEGEASIGSNYLMTDLAEGNYVLKLTDRNGCETSCGFEIDDPDCNLRARAVITKQISCPGASDGVAFAQVSNGVGDLRYSWKNGSRERRSENLKAGNHRVTVTDSRLCQIRASVRLEDPEPLILNCTAIRGTTTATSKNGIAEVSVSGGRPSYTVSWTGPQSGRLGTREEQRIYGLAPGSYRLVVSDDGGCEIGCEFNITSPMDSDGDGVIDSLDCHPGDPQLPAPPGTLCDDGNDLTEEDRIQSDSCTCRGEGEDSDDDGVPDEQDVCPGFDDKVDADGDGVPDGCDDDDDDDGVLDGDDICRGHDDTMDSDGDGTPDGCDTDDDGDGVEDEQDICAGHDDLIDSDGDGTPDGCDEDDDGDGVPDEEDICAGFDDTVDPDEDGIPDGCDDDDDGDGVSDEEDICRGHDDTMDSDGDGTPDGCDTDDDGDGVEDEQDICTGHDDLIDSDGDGTPDGCDEDDDGDGVSDEEDICAGFDDSLDTDGDGVPDGCDEDDDGDGIPDEEDICPGHDDAIDSDGDGTPDGCDTDDDGDGVEDDQDICPGHDDLIDSDGDGKPDGCDEDDDGDGVPDEEDICAGFDDTVDTDGDDIPDGCDEDDDGDGVLDDDDICPGHDDAIDSDGDGTPDGCDTDDDGDGVEDDQDICPGHDDLIDSDGDGKPDGCDEDDDGDGVPDEEDICAGFDDTVDTDEDGIPDGCDDDDDGDGVLDDDDICPGHDDAVDIDGDDIPDGCDPDIDGDGVPNELDCRASDPNLPAAPGTTCDDGDPFTLQDQILDDSCGCLGPIVDSCLRILNIVAIPPSDCDSDDGQIMVEVSDPLNRSIEYSADGGFTWSYSNQFSGLRQGRYLVAVRSANEECYRELAVAVGEFELPSFSVSEVAVQHASSCNQADGVIFLKIRSDESLQFSIDLGATWSSSANFTDISPGTYQLMVRQLGNECAVFFSRTYVVRAPGQPATVRLQVSDHIDLPCISQDGQIEVITDLDQSDLLFSLDNEEWFEANTFTGLAAGDYQIFARSRDKSCSFIVGSASIRNISISSHDVFAKPSSCYVNDGSIQVHLPEDLGVQFSLNNGHTWSHSILAKGLAPNIYPIQIRNEQGQCQEVLEVELLGKAQIEGISAPRILNPSCFGGDDGMIDLPLLEGLEARWGDGANQPTRSGLKAGEYSVRVIDSAYCFEDFFFQLQDPPKMKLDLSLDSIISLCADAYFEMKLPNSYTYELTAPGSEDSGLRDKNLVFDAAGEYILSAYDSIGCQLESSFEVKKSSSEFVGRFLLPSEGVMEETIVAVEISNLLPDSVHWEISGDGNIQSIEANQVNLIFDQAGTYSLTMYAYHGGCMSMMKKPIRIVRHTSELTINSSRSHTPISIGGMSIFPNPNDGQFNVATELETKEKLHLRVYNEAGQIIRILENTAATHHVLPLDLRSERSGTYTIIVFTEKEWRSSTVIIGGR